MKYQCAYCKKQGERKAAEVNRARKAGLNLYCNKHCSNLGRRKNKSLAQRKEEKRLYDLEYRAKNLEMLKVKKHAYHKRTYDPVKAAKYRKGRMHLHIEYCRKPKYKRWKQKYDQNYRAKRIFGPFA